MAKTKKKNKCSLDEINDSNKEILFDILGREGVESLTVSFEGSGDDGQIDSIELDNKILKIKIEGAKVSTGRTYCAAGGSQTSWKVGCTVGEVIHSICYEALELLYQGWEINDGSFGDFIFDVKGRTLTLEFNQRYVESELFKHEF
jgi:hypothetical protein